jgi:VanZ family protein
MVRVVASVTIGSLYGITDEWHQSFTFGRDASVWDWTADTAGAILAGSMVIGIWRRMAALQQRV